MDGGIMEDIMSFNFIDADLDKKTQGVWVEHEGNKFRIGAPSTVQTTECLEKHVKTVEGKRKNYKLKASEQYTCTVKTVVDLKLLDWDVTDSNGDTVEYSAVNAERALTSDPEFLAWVNEKSSDHTLFDKDKREEDIKK